MGNLRNLGFATKPSKTSTPWQGRPHRDTAADGGRHQEKCVKLLDPEEKHLLSFRVLVGTLMEHPLAWHGTPDARSSKKLPDCVNAKHQILKLKPSDLSHKPPKGPCTQIDIYFGLILVPIWVCGAKVYTIWVHGPLGNLEAQTLNRQP